MMQRTTTLTVTLAALLLLVPLYLWRICYPATDWAMLALTPLAAIIFVGYYDPAVLLRQAVLNAALHQHSVCLTVLKGRLLAGVRAGLFTLVAITVLAWQALTAKAIVVSAFVVMLFAIGMLSRPIQQRLQQYLHLPFARAWGMQLTALPVAIMFVPVMAYLNWSYISYPGAILSMDLVETMRYYINQLPERRGAIAEVLSACYALDAIKLWLVLNHRGFLSTLLYCLDAALVTVILAKTFIAIVGFFEYTLSKPAESPQ